MDNLTRLAPEAWARIEATGRRDLSGCSYGAIAALSLPLLWDDIVSDLRSLGPTTLPHEAKTVLAAHLQTAVDRFGEVEDVIVARQLAIKRGEKKKAKKLAGDVEKLWKKLDEWQDDEDVDGAIRDLRRLVRSS